MSQPHSQSHKIHLGCGPKYMPGWVNVDLYAEQVDIRHDLETVTFPAGSAAEVLTVHTLEHLHRADCVGLCHRIYDWLIPGGRFVVEMPDRDKCQKLLKAPDEKGQIAGAKGLLGGRADDKAEWNEWLIANRKAVYALAKRGKPTDGMIPPRFKQLGQQHLWVWGGDEFRDLLRDVGFVVSVLPPQHHAARGRRDTRWEGVRPA